MGVEALFCAVALFLQGADGGKIEPLWYLLAQPKVQRELSLSPDHVTRIAGVIREADAELTRRSKGEIARRAESREAMVLSIARPELRKVGVGLRGPRRVRLREISLQQCGPYVLSFAGVAETLGVSVATVRAVEAGQQRIIAAEAGRRLAYAKRRNVPMVSTKGGKIPAETPAIRRMEGECSAKLWAVLRQALTNEQNAGLRGLLGRPFYFDADRNR